MILDNEMIMANAVSDLTVAAHDSSIIDFGSAGAGYNKKVIVGINTASTSDGAATEAFSVVTSATEAFTSSTVLFATTAAAYTTMTKGKHVLEMTLPAETLRYVKVVHTIAVAALTAGKYNAYVTDVRQTNMTVI